MNTTNTRINFAYILLSQIANYVLPIFVLPHLANKFGPTNFGLINFAQNLIFYFNLIINFGFDLTATKSIAIHKNNKTIIGNIFSDVISTKIFLFILSLIIMFILKSLSSDICLNFTLYIILLIGLFGNVLYPTWMYQGHEDLKNISWINFILKTIINISILVIINKNSTLITYALILAIGQNLVGILSFYLAINKYKIIFQFSSMKRIIESINNSFAIFISNLSISIYASSSILILGIFSTSLNIGLFATGSKLIAAFESIVVFSFNQAFYPFMARKLSTEINRSILKEIKTYLKYAVLFCIASGISIIFLSHYIIQFFFGNAYIESIIVLKILAFIPGILIIRSILINQIIINLGSRELYYKINTICAIIGLSLTTYLAYKYDFQGTAWARLATEIVVLCIGAYYSYNVLNKEIIIH